MDDYIKWRHKMNVIMDDLYTMLTLLDLCVSSLRRGHANLLCLVPILTDDPRRKSIIMDDLCYIIT